MNPRAFRTHRDGREVCTTTKRGRHEYKLRIVEMLVRQGYACPLCGRAISTQDATFDHEVPRGAGGCFRNDSIFHEDGSWRNAAVHLICNGLKGSRRFRWNGLGKYVPNIREVQEAA